MQDCYKILGISRNATAAEIRRAYRQKAKLLHPDITGSDSKAFRELVKAYEVLSNAKSRSLFDESFEAHSQYAAHSGSKNSFDYRTWLIERGDEESLAKLIFLDLTHNREDAAVQEYKKMNMEHATFRMSYWFTREDFMDYGFILAEELILRAEYYDAVILLEQIIKMEYSYSYFKLFFPEVLNLARHVLKNNIEGNVNDELALDAWERALELNLGKKDDTFFLTKMSEAYRRLGDDHTADICLEEAARLQA